MSAGYVETIVTAGLYLALGTCFAYLLAVTLKAGKTSH